MSRGIEVESTEQMIDAHLLEQSIDAGTRGLQLSEGAIWYGLHMLERSGASMRQHITTENVYEQRLLPEVVSIQQPGLLHLSFRVLSTYCDLQHLHSCCFQYAY